MRSIEAHLARKAATDAGWEIPVADDGDWLRCASSRFDTLAWIGQKHADSYLVCFNEPRLTRILTRDEPSAPREHAPANPCLYAEGNNALYGLMQRAAELARSLPDNPCHEFQRKTKGLPRTTEAERLVVQRVGQEVFRNSLLDYWGGACAVTGLTEPSLLTASHAKPWARCSSDGERLDVFNGLLLAPHLDALFDGGWIGFEDDGTIRFADKLGELLARKLHIDRAMCLRQVEPEHQPYLAFHRDGVMTNS